MRFVDTNVLLYRVSRDAADRSKSAVSDAIIRGGDLALSTQVLQEFYVQATRATRSRPLTHEEAVLFVRTFSRFSVQSVTLEIVYAAVATHRRHQISYWDAAIIEAARMTGCREVLSEDLNHGQDYDGVLVINPFR